MNGKDNYPLLLEVIYVRALGLIRMPVTRTGGGQS
jgi:hypothetical protein